MPFERELSVVAVRGRDGEFRAWPLTENWHEHGVLSASLAPAQVAPALAARALAYARRVGEALDYVGVFALELFLRDGELLANEMAPRVHNSGHWTIEGARPRSSRTTCAPCSACRSATPRMLGHACMLNWIGEMPDASAVLREPGGHWHDYGKSAARGAQGRPRDVARGFDGSAGGDVAAYRCGPWPRGAGRPGDRGTAIGFVTHGTNKTAGFPRPFA